MTHADIATRDAMLAILKASTDTSAAWLLWSDEPAAHDRSLLARCDRLGAAKGLRAALRRCRRVLMTTGAIEALEGLTAP